MWNRILEGIAGSSAQKLILEGGILLGFVVTASLLMR